VGVEPRTHQKLSFVTGPLIICLDWHLAAASL
jgi:hypothetical protein